jgi:amidase
MTGYALKFAAAARRHGDLDEVHRAWARAHLMYQSLGPVLEAHDVFVCPTTCLPAVAADHDPFDPHFTVNGKPADAEYGWVMTHHFNMLHNCPVMSLPTGHAANGVPTGMQIVGRTFDDARVFKAALAFEQAVGGWYGTRGRRPLLQGL